MKNKDVAPKDHRIKTIAVATVAVALILSIGIWAITSALGSTKSTKTETSEATAEEATSSTTSAETEAVSPSSEYEVSDTVTTETVATSDLPATGPANVIISALGLGAVVALVLVNIELVKKQTV